MKHKKRFKLHIRDARELPCTRAQIEAFFGQDLMLIAARMKDYLEQSDNLISWHNIAGLVAMIVWPYDFDDEESAKQDVIAVLHQKGMRNNPELLWQKIKQERRMFRRKA